MNFVGSLDGATAVFSLSLPNSPIALSSSLSGKLKDYGLSKAQVVSVEWLTEDPTGGNAVFVSASELGDLVFKRLTCIWLQLCTL